MSSEVTTTISGKIARIVSLVFHPLFMPLYGLLILLSAPTFLEYLPLQIKKILVLIVLINNVLLPLAFLPFFRFRNVISSYSIEDRQERLIPLFTTSIFYCTTSFIIFRYQIPYILKSFIFATSALSIIVSMITFWWKISLHAAGAGALAATVFVLSIKMYTPLTGYLLAVIIAGGLVLSSRLRLNSHNPLQVWTGFVTGILVITFFVFLI